LLRSAAVRQANTPKVSPLSIRGTFVYRDGELVPKHLAAPLIPRGARSTMSAPYLIGDTTDAFQSMADGKMYDSKSSYRAELKRQGLREIGNDIDGHLKDVVASNPQKPKAKADVIKAYQKVKQGYRPPPAPPLDPELE
jgi:hypothetical protein